MLLISLSVFILLVLSEKDSATGSHLPTTINRLSPVAFLSRGHFSAKQNRRESKIRDDDARSCIPRQRSLENRLENKSVDHMQERYDGGNRNHCIQAAALGQACGMYALKDDRKQNGAPTPQ